MKKILFTLTLLLTSFSLVFISCSDDDDDIKRIELSQIPATAQEFIKSHFNVGETNNESEIRYVGHDKNGTYEVTFTNGVEVDFYSNGVWKEIDLNGRNLPTSIAMLIPEKALNYISDNYPNAIIEEIEKQGAYAEQQGFKIELRNDRDIYFGYLGNVVKDNNDSNGGKEPIGEVGKLPAIAQEFLGVYFKGLTPDKIELEWNKYEVVYNNDKANEVEIEFNKDGTFKNIEVDGVNQVIRSVISGVSKSDAILKYIDQNYSGHRIEEFSMASAIVGENLKGGYVVELDGKPDYKVYFNVQGQFVSAVKD